MSAQFEPSVEMIEAGARRRHELFCVRTGSSAVWGCLNDAEKETWLIDAREMLRAALGLVLSDPCPTCGGTGRVSLPSPTRWVDGVQITDTIAVYGPCPDCPRRVWAWLRAAQNSGVMETVGWRKADVRFPTAEQVERSRPDGDGWVPTFVACVSVPEEGT